MSSTQGLLDEMSQRGVTVRVEGKTLRIKPRKALDDDLIARIKEHKPEIIRALAPQAMPEGIHLVRWEPKPAPVALTRVEIVNDVPMFITATMKQLRAALVGSRWLAGNHSVRELIERLAECGVVVEVKSGRV